jgi:hypothetical protein
MLWTLEFLPLIMRALARAPYAYQMVGMNGFAPFLRFSQNLVLTTYTTIPVKWWKPRQLQPHE